MSDSKPNPGSEQAIKEGCVCPRIDNGHGNWAYTDKHGNRQFWLRDDCPLHGLERKGE